MTTAAILDTRTGDFRDLATFHRKADATAAGKATGFTTEVIRARGNFVWNWAPVVVLNVDEDLVRLLVLGADGQWRRDTYTLPDGMTLAPRDLTVNLVELAGQEVDVMDRAGDVVRAVMVEVIEGDVVLRRANGRVVMRPVSSVVAVRAAHRTGTVASSSIDRTWAVKPSGRAQGWRATETHASAHCSCGWSRPAATRAEARGLASTHRRPSF